MNNNSVFSNKKSGEKALSNIIIIVCFLLLLITSLNNVRASISIVGFFSIAILFAVTNFLLFVYLTRSNRIAKVHVFLLFFALAYTTFLIIGLLNNPTSRGVQISSQFILCIGFFLFCSLIYWDKYKIEKIGNIIIFFIFIHFIIWASQGFKPFFTSIYNNSNLVGAYMVYSIFFLLWAKTYTRKKLIFFNIMMIVSSVLILSSNTRSVILAGVVGIITFIIWRIITKNKFLFISYFSTIYFLILFLPLLYSQLPKWRAFPYIENLVLEYTGKSLMSGRQDIWGPLISNINKNPIIGFGAGTTTGLPKSTHNLYLNIAMQNGYLGLVLFSIILLIIWGIFWKTHKNNTVRLVASFFIVTIVYQTFEITFTEHQLSVGLIQWFIISIGISEYLYTNKILKIRDS